jgi:hypothetical protein
VFVCRGGANLQLEELIRDGSQGSKGAESKPSLKDEAIGCQLASKEGTSNSRNDARPIVATRIPLLLHDTSLVVEVDERKGVQQRQDKHGVRDPLMENL